MAVTSEKLYIYIADYKIAIEKWTIFLERTNSWQTPQRVTVGPSATCSTETEHDMIEMGDSMLKDSNKSYEDLDFESHILIDFLRKLPSLCDLEWRVNTPLMPSLLQFLRDERPSCNLHLKPFNLPYDAEPSYVRSILNLPGLRTIWFKRKFDGAVEEIVQHMARAADGNVREVRIYWGFTGASPWGQPLPDMWEEELAAPDGQPLGQVQSLQLTGAERADEAHLETWTRHTDFSHLRTLSLEMLVTRTGLETLINLPLQSLHSLGLKLDWSDTSEHYSATLQSFLCGLPRLSHLRLTGDLPPSTLQAILDHLDPTLHTLSLDSRVAFDSHTITLLTSRCTYVHSLSLPIRRVWNNPGEDTAILRAIGRIPHLTHLTITLDASDRTLLSSPSGAFLAPSHSSFSTFDNETFPTCFSSGKEVRNGHIRDALINSAIDASLAKAIFSTILSGTPEGRTSSLRRLSLKADGGGSFGTSTHNRMVNMIADEVGRKLIVERSGDGDEGLAVHRVEVDTWWLEPGDELTSSVEPVFRSIWPGEGDWWNEWNAFPLF